MRVISRLGLLLGSLGLVTLSVLPAQAAEKGRAADSGGSEIAGGYSYVYDSDGSTAIPAGWFFSASAGISDAFSMVGDISGNYKSDSVASGGVTATASVKIHTFLAGPRVSGRSGQVSFYGQFLVGAASVSGGVTTNFAGTNLSMNASETDFCLAPGAGVDIAVSERSGIRAGMAERLIRSNGTTSKEFQLQIGLVYRFGR